MITPVVVIASCILLEAFFSGAELALIAADSVRLRHRAEQYQGRRRRRLLRFIDNPGDLISAALTGTNICVVLSAVTATVSLLPRYPDSAELISLAVITPLVLVFGEIVPKSVFQHFADRLAPRLVDVLSIFRLIFLPVVALGRRLAALLMGLLRIRAERALMTRDELRLLITLPSRPGEDRITADEKQMIARIFEFSEMRAADVMLPLSEVTALPATSTIEDVAREITDKQHTRLPVYGERVDQIEGIIHCFDVLRAERGAELSSLLRTPIFVPENQPAVDTLVRLQREGQHMAVVVDEYGGAVGVITIDDILEEIVGEIRDEYDEQAAELIRRLKGGAYRVQGRTHVEHFNAIARLKLPVSDDYETVAGLVLHRLERIPRVGEELALGMVVISVSSASDRSVEEVLIRPAGRR